MLDINDFRAKQLIVCFCNDGEKISVNNDNIVVKDKDAEIKCQATCYRIFSVFIVGQTSITTALIDRAKKFNFSIVLFTTTFRILEVIGFRRDANTLLHRKQYEYQGLDLAKYVVINKINNQRSLLNGIRHKSDDTKKSIDVLSDYAEEVHCAQSLQEIMGYEGLASKRYFQSFFEDLRWDGRSPRTKRDYINSTLDVGYTILFSYIEALLSIYGFDLYCGILHTSFYMRKSLVCDIMEPFRVIIDRQIKKSINLKQFQESDFSCENERYVLQWKQSPKYVKVFLEAILSHKETIFLYVRQYYRSFMKKSSVDLYPVWSMEGIDDYLEL